MEQDQTPGDPVASLEVSLRAPVRERSRLEGNQLVVELTPEAADAAEGAAAQARPAPSPAGPGQTPQASQGSQYGQPGFVGEPISVNVVNSDIRDILNYITEQYGVNFVVDSSVKQVPADLVHDGRLVKGLAGALTVLRDAGFSDTQALRWLLTEDPAIAERPVDAMAAGRDTAVKRRAQVLAF